MNKAAAKKAIKKFIIFIIGFIAVCIILFAFFLIKVQSRLSARDGQYKENVRLDSSVGTSAAQRIEDFNELCAVLEARAAMLYDYEELYDLKYSDIKAYYRELIENSESEVDYYAAMLGFLYNIPSAHLGIMIPDSFLKNRYTDNTTITAAQKYWNGIISDEYKKCCEENVGVVRFSYISGDYYDKENDMSVLISVNDMQPEEYVKLISSSYALKYDHFNGKPFRSEIDFNNSRGSKCTVKYKTADGSIHTETMFCGGAAEIVFKLDKYFDYFNTEEKNENAENIFEENYIKFGKTMIVNDTERNTLFVQIDSFSGDETSGRQTANIINKFFSDNIIIDLRNNGGGMVENAYAVLPSILSEDIDMTDFVYCTKESYKLSPDFYKFRFDKEKQLYRCKECIQIKGGSEKKKNIYILVSDSTASAAETFVNIIKNNKLGTAVGTNNTAGEAHGSVYWGYLKNSGLAYTYTEFKCFNPDGTSNSAYGTAPDIYSALSVENYILQRELIENGEDPYTYENRLKWDNVLIETLEIIKEKENKK